MGGPLPRGLLRTALSMIPEQKVVETSDLSEIFSNSRITEKLHFRAGGKNKTWRSHPGCEKFRICTAFDGG